MPTRVVKVYRLRCKVCNKEIVGDNEQAVKAHAVQHIIWHKGIRDMLYAMLKEYFEESVVEEREVVEI